MNQSLSSRIGSGKGKCDFSFHPFSEILYVCYSHLCMLTSVNFCFLLYLMHASMVDVKWSLVLWGAGCLQQEPAETTGHFQTCVQSFAMSHLLIGTGKLLLRLRRNFPAPTRVSTHFSFSDWEGRVQLQGGMERRKGKILWSTLICWMACFHSMQVGEEQGPLFLKKQAGS